MRKIHWQSFPCLCTDCVSSLARCLFRYFSSFKLNYFLLLSSNRFFVIRFWIWSFIRYIFQRFLSVYGFPLCVHAREVCDVHAFVCECGCTRAPLCQRSEDSRGQQPLPSSSEKSVSFVSGPQACRRFPDSSPTSLQEHQSKRTHHHTRSNIAQYLHGKPFTLWATPLALAVKPFWKQLSVHSKPCISIWCFVLFCLLVFSRQGFLVWPWLSYFTM